MTKIVLDSNVIIFGIKKQASPEQNHMIERAENFIKLQEQDRNTKIIIPSIVLAEACVKIEDGGRNDFAADLKKRFWLVPFDTRKAIVYGRLYKSLKESGRVKEMIQNGYDRKHLSPDCQIMAVAKEEKADLIVTHDKRFRELCDGIMSATDIPRTPIQGDLGFD